MDGSSSRPSSNTSRPPSITRNYRDNFVASFESLPPESPVQNELNEEVNDIEEMASDEEITSSKFPSTSTVEDWKPSPDSIADTDGKISPTTGNEDSKTSPDAIVEADRKTPPVDTDGDVSPTDKYDETQSCKESSPSPVESEMDVKIRKGLQKIERLDHILTKKVKREKQVKKERREFEKEFKTEVQNLIKEKGKSNICGSEQLLALCNATSDTKSDNITEPPDSIFSTQIDPKYYESHFTEKHSAKSNKAKSASPEKKSKKKTDYVNRNIELASNANDGILMTEEERERLDKILADENGLLFTENPFTTPAISETAYTFTDDEIQSIIDIDMKLKELLPQKDFELLGVASEPETAKSDISPSDNGEKIGKSPAKNNIDTSDSLLEFTHVEVDCGEKVLQEKRDERSVNMRLKDIDQELKKLKSLEDENSTRIDPDLLVMLLDSDSRLTSKAVSISESVSSRADLLSVDTNREEITAH